jgi:sugar-specific transcriptional regulator TrmB
MRAEQIVSYLLKLGLTEGEAKVYITLLKGSSSKSEIIKNSEVSSSVIYKILEKLMRRGLVSYIDKDGKRKFYASNPEKLLDIIANERKRVGELEKNGRAMIPLLKQIPKEKLLFATVYKGLDGLKAMIKEIEDEIKNKETDEWLAMGVTS